MEAGKRPVLQALLLALCLLAAAAAGAGLHALYSRGKTGPPAKAPFAGDTTAAEKIPANLYFGDATGPFLTAEERVLPRDPDPVRFARSLMEALLAGPTGNARVRVIPEATRLLAVHLPGNGLCIADLSSEIAEGQPGSVTAEALTVLSIVDTLTLNLDDVSRVQILVAGQPRETLAGHLGTAGPFSADMALIR